MVRRAVERTKRRRGIRDVLTLDMAKRAWTPHCNHCGFSFYLNSAMRNTPEWSDSPCIDRIDTLQPTYGPNNFQFLCRGCNRKKADYDVIEQLDADIGNIKCGLYREKKKAPPSTATSMATSLKTWYEKRKDSDDTYIYRTWLEVRDDLKYYEKRAIDFFAFRRIWNAQNGLCVTCRVPLNMGKQPKTYYDDASLVCNSCYTKPRPRAIISRKRAYIRHLLSCRREPT